jgi:hypothetical protein
MRHVNPGSHIERLTRWDAKIIQEQQGSVIPSRLDMHWNKALRLSGNHPSCSYFKSELRYTYRQIACIPHVNLDSHFLNPALILPDTREASFVVLREPNTHSIYLRTVRGPAVSEEDYEGEQQGACAKPGRYVPPVQMRHGLRLAVQLWSRRSCA